MKWSKYFLYTTKESAVDASSCVSRSLMTRACMITQASAGIYSWLPMGFRVMQKISAIIRKMHDEVGMLEILMPTLQLADIWRTSGRYDVYGDEMLRIVDRQKRDMLYGPTNEEQVTEICAAYLKSYKQLPLVLYHIQWKFRDELRPRFGVMRGREFLMKDAYSFDIDRENAEKTYWKFFDLYVRIFKALGLTAIPVRADSGPIGGDLSHEFHVLAETGESEIFFSNKFLDDSVVDKSGLYSNLVENHSDNTIKDLMRSRSIEVGHIFYFGKKYSEAFKLAVTDEAGVSITPEMGSYGIGVSRLVGAVIEAFHDKDGICWPMQIAPFHVGLIGLWGAEEISNALYTDLVENNIEVLYDDRDLSNGAKFMDMDLIGLPIQIIVGKRDWDDGIIEVKFRSDSRRVRVSKDNIIQFIKEQLCN